MCFPEVCEPLSDSVTPEKGVTSALICSHTGQTARGGAGVGMAEGQAQAGALTCGI